MLGGDVADEFLLVHGIVAEDAGHVGLGLLLLYSVLQVQGLGKVYYVIKILKNKTIGFIFLPTDTKNFVSFSQTREYALIKTFI